MPKQIASIRVGDWIVPRVPLYEMLVRNWEYADESDEIYGTIPPGTELEVTDISTQPGDMWIEVELPRRAPEAHLVISAEEYQANFR